MKISIRLQIPIAIAAIFFSDFSYAATYSVSFLPSLGESYNTAYAINNAGQIVGESGTNDNKHHAILWNSKSQLVDLDILSGQYSYAKAINTAGQVVGNLSDSAGYNAILWNNGTPIKLDSLGGSTSYANGVNDSGQVVGVSLGINRAVIWNGTTATALASLGGSSSAAYAINNAGQIVGYEWSYNGSRAIVWGGSTATYLGDIGSAAFDINEAGAIIGQNGGFATLWSNGVATILSPITGGYSSRVTSINNSGQVVGNSFVGGAPISSYHATLWNGATGMDLNDYLPSDLVGAGWLLSDANGINDKGFIVGLARNSFTGASRGFLMSVTDVPEAPTYALVLAGLGLIAGVSRRRSKQH
jgi:MYXO-CTERM domain-containing protein